MSRAVLFISMQAFLSGGLSLSGAAQPKPNRVLIRVYNKTHVSRAALSRAEQVASEIFAEAGLTVSWADGSLEDHQATSLDFSGRSGGALTCSAGRDFTEIRVGLVRGPSTEVMTNTLGLALPCAQYGSDATIFVDRCEAVMLNSRASFPKILGHAMAHEIGHVLLGSNAHSAAGLMKARWDTADWLRVAAAHVPIAQVDAKTMRENVG